MSILVIGEALIDITEDRRVDPPSVAEHVGGSPANVALGLARLDEDVELLTSIARDARGERIAAELTAAGVRVRPESWSAERTATATATIAGGATGGSATYEFDLTWALPDLDRWGALADIEIVHTGSLGAYLDPGAPIMADLVRQLRAGGALVGYDPNVRESLIESVEDTRARILENVAGADMVKLSDEDALWLYPGGAEDALRAILDLGPRLVVVTAGAGGSMMATPSGWIPVAPVRVPIADTIGAGDSYMAALLAEIRHRVVTPGRDLSALGFDELSAIGARCERAAGITVSRIGANPPTLAEVLATEIGD